MIKRKKLLNLYSGLGGNVNLLSSELYEITSVELEPNIAEVYSKLYPEHNLIIGDAHEYLINHFKEYDIIWSSPPCQTHSKMAKATRHDLKRYTDMSLYQEILLLMHFFKGKWVVENVKPYYDPLIKPSIEIGRHLIWSNFDISNFEIKTPRNFINTATVKGSEQLKDWLGIQYKGNLYYKGNHCPAQVLRNCVHPEMGLHIINCLEGINVPVIKNQIDIFDIINNEV